MLALSVLALTALGVVIVHSAGAILSEKRHGDPFHFLERQALHAAIGIGALVVALLVDPRFWLRWSGLLYLGTAVLLIVLCVVPSAGETKGIATRWLNLGPVRFQPAELAKVALLLFLSAHLARRAERLSSLGRGVVPALLLAGVLLLPVLLQPDFGTTVTLGVATLALLLAAGARLRHLGLLLLAAAPLVYWLIDGSPYRRARMLAFLDPFAHRREEGYQIYESLVSFGSGGWTGVGLGEGPQKLGYFPEYHNDFVLSAVGEELGLLGVAAVIAVFGVILWRGLRIAARTEDRALSHLAFGITALIGFQAILHMGVVMAVLPTKGLPLPFVSYGGTSLVVMLFLAGVLLSIGARAPVREAA
jgi:cell division protein FtsW